MFATALLIPAAADAGFKAPQVTKVIASSPTDFAPITDATTTPGRLQRTDENQPGNEMAHLAMFGDGIHGLFFSMNTDLVDPANPTIGHLAPDRIQLAMVPFSLVKNTDGTISAKVDYTGLGSNTDITGGARFVTNNQGNEYRNANHPIAYAINGGNVICAEYNYQPNNGNNTERYMQCFNQSGATIMPQTQIYAKNNDDCSMNQDYTSTTLARVDGLKSRLVAWRGCNGNGDDDGWAQVMEITVDNATTPTVATFAQLADVSLCPREERSHGLCTVGTDNNTAICTWTEGNTQPQRDGTWMAAIDISGTKTGPDMIYWKQQIDGRKTLPDGTRTYSMRAMHDRVMTIDQTTGAVVPTDMVFWRSGDVHGNNNGNAKGGTYYGNQVAVIKATAAGMQYVVPMTDMSTVLLGTDGTHLGMHFGIFGSTDKPTPGIVLMSGSHTGGGYPLGARVVAWDEMANKLIDGGSFSGAPYDRHLYPNYLGNNPGNQGRNYSGVTEVVNPFATGAAGEDKFLMLMATTGKDPSEVPSQQCLDCAQKKLSAYITVVPVAQGNGTPGGGKGSGSGSGGTGGDSQDPGSTLGGCSTGGTSGAASLLLIGLAGFIRRRRR